MSSHRQGRLTPLSRAGARRAIACGVLAAVLGAFAPQAAARQQSAAASFVDSGTVTLVEARQATDIDPASLAVAAPNIAVSRNIYETLVEFNGADVNHFVPLLATSWQSNADDSVWTFHLRHGVRFHTGRCCMTADDVRYTIARSVLAGQGMAYLFARYFSNPLKQIKVLDPYTVEFDLGRPQYTFLRAIASKNGGLIEDSVAIKKHATKSDPWAHNWATDHDAGTGPYMLQSWQHGQQVVLTRFVDYWRGWSGRHFSTAYLRTVPEPATRRDLLERGQADITFGLTPLDDLALRSNPAVKVIAPYGTAIDFIAMTQYGPLASPLARQALSYAFPYDAMLTAAFHGFARRAYGPLASTLYGYDPHMFHYHTDLNKARELLAKAGVKPGTTLTYLFESGNEPQRVAGLLLQAQLSQIGITLKPQGVDDATHSAIYFGTEPASKRPNLMAYDWWPDYNDPYDMAVPLIASYSAGANGANGGYYHDKQVDALLADMRYANSEKLLSDARKLQDITGRVDPPMIWTDEPAQVTILAHNLHGYVFNPLDLQIYGFYSMYRS